MAELELHRTRWGDHLVGSAEAVDQLRRACAPGDPLVDLGLGTLGDVGRLPIYVGTCPCAELGETALAAAFDDAVDESVSPGVVVIDGHPYPLVEWLDDEHPTT